MADEKKKKNPYYSGLYEEIIFKPQNTKIIMKINTIEKWLKSIVNLTREISAIEPPNYYYSGATQGPGRTR